MTARVGTRKTAFVHLCLFLLGILCIASGAWFGCQLLGELGDHLRMKEWQEVPCRILGAALVVRRDSRRGDSYCVQATYGYSFNGRNYTSRRVSIHTEADNLGDFQRDTYAELERCRLAETPFRCYVDPVRPAEAILFPRARWEVLAFRSMIVYIFVGCGLPLVGLGPSAFRVPQGGEDPQQPWLRDREWAQGAIRYSMRRTVAARWIAVALAVVFSLPTLVVCGEEVLGRQNYGASIGLAFVASGAILTLWALRATLTWRKYGESVFQMASVPGLVGGPLAGVIRTSARVEAKRGFLVTLRCRHRVTTGSGKKRRTKETVVWEGRRRIARPLEQDDFDKIGIPVLFAIPFHAMETTGAPGHAVHVLWALEVRAETPGIDYRARFEVPVFRTAESRADFQLDESAIAGYTASPEDSALGD